MADCEGGGGGMVGGDGRGQRGRGPRQMAEGLLTEDYRGGPGADGGGGATGWGGRTERDVGAG